MKKVLLALTALFAVQAVSAQTIFSCKVKSGKVARLEKIGGHYQYSFGKPGSPEITVKNSANQVLSNRLTGRILYAYSASVSAAILNGQHTYVLHSYDSTKGDGSADIVVLKNNKKLAQLACVDWHSDFDDAIINREADEALVDLVR